jgi:hypothetical protein
MPFGSSSPRPGPPHPEVELIPRRLALGAVAGLLSLGAAAGCSAGDWGRGWSVGAVCTLAAPGAPLPEAVRESSGVAPVSGSDHLFWTHNDSGGAPELFIVDLEGHDLGRVRVAGASNRDWEDLAAGSCPGGGRCLYIADTGDNREIRRDPAIYRIPEPDPGDSVSAPAHRFSLRFPEGPRDVEALYLLPPEKLFLVTKGRNHPVEVYRVPPLEGDQPLDLELVQVLTDGPVFLPSMVTGADATPDGTLVVIRTYEAMVFHRPGPDERLSPLAGGFVNLRPLREMQGEAVAWAGGNRWVLTSEGGPGISRGSIHLLECPLQP